MIIRAYTGQINQDYYDIEVPDNIPKQVQKDIAKKKAKELWKKDYYPEIYFD